MSVQVDLTRSPSRRRTTGICAKPPFAFVGPNWKGTLPADVIEHRMPTNTVMFAIRIGVVPQDDEDLQKVNALQEQLRWIGPISTPTIRPRWL